LLYQTHLQLATEALGQGDLGCFGVGHKVVPFHPLSDSLRPEVRREEGGGCGDGGGEKG